MCAPPRAPKANKTGKRKLPTDPHNALLAKGKVAEVGVRLQVAERALEVFLKHGLPSRLETGVLNAVQSAIALVLKLREQPLQHDADEMVKGMYEALDVIMRGYDEASAGGVARDALEELLFDKAFQKETGAEFYDPSKYWNVETCGFAQLAFFLTAGRIPLA